MPQSLSISFTLGKASIKHQANIPHSNREFIARNIDRAKTHENITYVRQDVEDAYHKLFDDAVKEYNKNQKQKCRRIEDYYQHISDGKREEAFYEIIVQFGDSKTAPCGSQNGKTAQKMLDEYVRSFQKRNPNLHVFNAVMHLDEASPHLHINFVPFYTKARKNGLSKGVSMKAALDEQGFDGKNFKENRLVAWEESERMYMEKILNAHGYMRDDKNAKYAHMTVEEFKKDQDEKKIVSAIRKQQHISPDDLARTHVQHLHNKLNILENEKKELEIQKRSPYKAFYYSSPDKQAFVQSKLDDLQIPYRETENGLEAQECYADEIRKIEKLYIAPKTGHREKLRQDIDLLLMQSKDFDELLSKLERTGYQIKRGKYIALKPNDGDKFIRLKTLGEHYSEYALKNRLQSKKKFEQELDMKIKAESKRDTPKAITLQTIRFYTITFAKGALPMRKRDVHKPFAWTNDAELDKILLLNKKINEGATIDSFRSNFKKQERAASECEANLKKSRNDLKSFYELKEKIEIVFEGKKSSVFTMEQAQMALRQFPDINQRNYGKIQILIDNELKNVQKAEEAFAEESQKLKEASDLLSAAEKIMGGTYIQSLVGEERQRRESEYMPNGLKPAGN